jgi:PAS domain S-box-containing protein
MESWPRPIGAPTRCCRRYLAGMAVACAVVAQSFPAAAVQEQQAAVLTFYATRREAPAASALDRTLERLLGAGLGGQLDYYTEFLDLARFDEPDYPDIVRDFLRAKYKRQRFDLIVATSNASAEFVERYRDDLFSGTPIVLSTGPRTTRGPNATGVTSELNFEKTLQLAARLQPDTTNVVVVSGASPWDKYYEHAARDQFKAIEGRLTFTYLSGLSMPALLDRVASLPAHTIIYFLSVVEDGAGSKFVGLDSLDQVADVANAPIYSWHTVAMGRRIVGGSLQSTDLLGAKIAEVGLRVLRGERAESIPVAHLDANVDEFDWRQLRRWGISESLLPSGSVVRYRQPGTWERYRVYIFGAFGLLALQTILIATLLVQRARRIQTERRLRQKESRYAMATSAGAVGVWDWTLKTDEIYVDPALKAILGYGDDEIRNHLDDWGRLVHPDDRDAVMAKAQPCREGRADEYEVEHRMLHKDGSVRWFLARGSIVRGPDDIPYRMVGTDIDITHRKRADEIQNENDRALAASHREIQNLAGRLIAAQEAERTRIARDLHDDVSQQLAGLSITLSSLVRRTSQAAVDEETRRALTSLQERTIAVADSIRHLSHDLHPGVLQHAGLVAALTAYCAEYRAQQAVEVTLHADEAFGPIDPEPALCLYRVAQEALRNVIRHANARHATVRLVRLTDHAELTIADDGKGFDFRQSRRDGDGLGLVSISERVGLARGTISIVTQPNQGTTIQVRIPLQLDRAGETGRPTPGRAFN